jgi:hypothetical protein
MRNKQILLLAALTGLTGCVLPPPGPPAPPPGSHPTVTVTNGGSLITENNTLATAGGQTIRLAFLHNQQNPDCSLDPVVHPTLNITAQASHGTVTPQQTEAFPTYPANSPLVKCDQARIAGTLLTYTPQAGYSGTDQFSYQIFSSDGRELIVNSTVNIAP